jgi:tetratricopeptide (TPR) repeat protein
MKKLFAMLFCICISCNQNKKENIYNCNQNDKTSINFDRKKYPILEEGITLREKGEFKKAIEKFNLAEKKYGKMVAIFINRGKTFGLNKETKNSITDFNSAIKMNKNEPIIYINRAKIYFKNNETRLGCNDLQRANKIDANHNFEEETSILLIENCK